MQLKILILYIITQKNERKDKLEALFHLYNI